MRDDPEIHALGDTALTVDFGETLDLALIRQIHALDAGLRDRAVPGVVETVPTYRALTVHFDPLVADPDSIASAVRALLRHPMPEADGARDWEVPVCYGGAFGEDLDTVARTAGLSARDCIAAHAAGAYVVAMIGFLPGFSYLAGLDPRLATPRRAAPRPRIPASSISIGGRQTAIGSVPGPSGWHLIGRTPVRPFMPGRDPVFLFAPGDRIRFRPVPAGEWDDLDRLAATGAPVAARLDP